MAARKRTRSRGSTVPSETSSGASPGGRRTALIAAAALVAVTVAAYTPVWQFDFVAVDDPQYVYDNPNIANGLSIESVRWALTTGRESNWHPLTWMSHALDVRIYGLWAGGHHLGNLVLHLASTLLLFGVWRRMTASVWRSAFVAAVFAIHPLHVESVAWVAERKDVLSGLFFMLTLGAYVRYVEAASRRRFAIVAACLALGLMSKPMLVTMPFVLLLLDYWPLGRARERTWASLVTEKVPLFLMVAASSVVTFVVQRRGGAVKDFETFPLALRIQNAISSYLQYLIDAVWPAGLGNFYPFPASLESGPVAIAAAVMIAITIVAVRLARRAPYVIVGWFWYLAMLVPVIGIVQVGGQARADRYMYLPIVGLAVAAAWGATSLLRTSGQRRALAIAASVAVVASTVAANRQVQLWRNTVAIWSHTAAVTEGMNNFGVYFGLGEYLQSTGRAVEAIPYFEAAIARRPSYAPAHRGLVRALLDARQPERAALALEESLRLDPSSVEGRMSLGLLFIELGRPEAAIVHFTEVVRLQPNLVEAHWRLGLALATIGRIVEALPAFAEAARLDPGSAPIRSDYGWALAQHGQPAAAYEQLNEALRLKPDLVEARHNMGRLLAADGRIPEALTHLSEAVRLDPEFYDARISLAVALDRAGRRDEAAAQLREVLRRDPGNAAATRMLSAMGKGGFPPRE
jgi:tetratricopeptide (TPR) repeat protein